ncbi:hypothetical protein ONZ51_g1653 [Trametes cubensis]|uniref:Uncharacterized protein n=1 Tax=Trametes cubensis TaxID=1111947 RepID=A0AAD7U274_9APHY|nr:hypothetical protein ONZ51_g1653 [Trametes cubensis]
MPSVNDLFHKDVAHSLFDEFDEESSSLPSLPPTINVVDRDVLRARRRSDKKAAKILDITIAREDNDADVDMASPTYPEWSGIDGLQPPVQGARRTSLSQLNMGSLTLLDSPMDEDEGAPLIEKSSPTKGARAGGESGKTRKKLAFIFRKLGRRKAPKAKNPNPAPRATLGPLVPTSENDENPFGDEHRMQWADEEDNGSPSGAVGGVPDDGECNQLALAPKTPQRGRSTSAPTTPRSSKSKKGTPNWQCSPKTPLSARSWRSECSPGSISASSALSVTSTLRRKNARRRIRLLKSQMKSLQILGSEASAAVALATNVKETKLRYRDFGRQIRDEFKRV